MPQLHSQRVVKTRVRFFSFLWLILAGFWTQFAIANNNLLASMSLISNDAPCDAILLSVGNTCNPVVSTTENSTDSGVGDPECDEYGKQDVWFKAVIPLSGSMVIETITETDLGSVFQPDRWLNSLGLAVYNGSCYSLASMACTANNNGKNPHDAMAYLFDENPGDTIYIRVFDTKEGKFNRFSICAYDPGNGFFENFPKNICSSEGPIDLNSKIQESKHGNADLVISSNKASTPNKILGVPDGEYAGLYHYGEMLTVDLTDTIPKGEIIELYFTTSYATVGYSSISLATSLDNETYTALSYKPASLTNAIKPVYIVAENDTRYVKLINENNFAGFIVDAIQYHYGRSKAGVWSGPGVLDHVFYPEKQSGQIPITYSVGTISEKVDSTIYINVLNSNGGKLSRDTTVCYGSAEFYLKLSDYSGEIIQWQSSQDDFLSYSDHRVTSDRFLIEKPTRATSYRVIVQDGTCLQDTSNVVAVKVHQPVRALLSGGTTLCEGEEAQLQLELTGEAPWKVVYAQNSEMISLDDIMNSPATIQVTPLTTTTYQLVSVENAYGCKADASSDVTVSVNAASSSAMRLEQDVCGNKIDLSSPLSAGAGSWSMLLGTGMAEFRSDDINLTTTVEVDAYGEYSFKWNEKDNECANVAYAHVSFVEMPQPTVAVDKEICGLKASLKIPQTSYDSYWSILEGDSELEVETISVNEEYLLKVSEPGDYKFQLLQVNGACKDSVSFELQFKEQPLIKVEEYYETIGNQIEIVVNAIAEKIEWTLLSGLGEVDFIPAPEQNSTILKSNEYGMYEVQIEASNGLCTNRQICEVYFKNAIRSNAGPDQILDFAFETNLEAIQPSESKGTWSVISGRASLQDRNDPNTLVTNLSLGVNEFVWTVERNGVERLTDTVSVTVNDLLVPTVITPNNDGVNDCLVFRGIENHPLCSVIIYNRWGSEVYRSLDYKNEWQGTNQNGHSLLPDVYYYVLSIAERVVNGFIEIRK